MSSSGDLSDLPVTKGEVIAGRYAVTGVLGRGGMGVVLAGRHLELGERVAIKFLHKEHVAHADRFFREARAAARIRSEHVVRIFDVGRLPTNEPYIVMEYLEGEDLSSRLEKRGPMELATVGEILLDVCAALAEAHAVGIVHRDLKPANIFLSRAPGGDELVKLLDFGVAKVPDAGAITKTANILGSPVYMSPEQLLASREVDARSDIWSLGIILYQLLTAELPFEGDSLVHLGIVVREKPTPRAHDKRPDLPEEIDTVIARCLAKQRTDRYSDVAELAEALTPFVPSHAAPSISRLKRIVAEGRRQSNEALASTIPPALDHAPSSSEPIPKSPGVPQIADDANATVRKGNAEFAGSASLAAVSTAAPKPAPPKSRRSVVVFGGIAIAGTIALLIAGKHLLSSPSEPTSHLDAATPATTTTLTPTPTAPSSTTPHEVASAVEPDTSTSTRAVASGTPPPSSHVPIARPPPTPRPIVTTKPDPAAARSASAAPPASPSPATNCNPPYTIDAQGMRHPKPECM